MDTAHALIFLHEILLAVMYVVGSYYIDAMS